MFHRRLANLFEPLGVVSSAAHQIQILRDHRMIVVWQFKPIQVHLSVITGDCLDREADLRSNGIIKLRQPGEVSNDDIGARLCANRRHRQRMRLAIQKLVDLYRLHRYRNRDFPNHQSRV